MGNNFIQDLLDKIKNKLSKKSEDDQDWVDEANEDEVEDELSHREDIEDEQEDIIEEEPSSEFVEMKKPKSNIFKSLFRKKPNSSKEKISKIQDYISDLKAESFISSFFSTKKRYIINHYFIVFNCLFAAYYTGTLVATKLSTLLSTPSKGRAIVPFKKPYRPIDFSAIGQFNIFNAVERLDGEKVKQKKGKEIKKPKFCFSADKKSSLPIKLVNTIVLQDSNKSVASILIRNNREPENFRENETIKGLAKIGKINRLSVVFKNLNNEDCEFIENIDENLERNFAKKNLQILQPKEGKKLIDSLNLDKGITNVGNSFKIKNSIREEMLGDISNVLTQARAIQIKNPNGTLSFKMTEIVPGSIYSKLNIKDGDILTKIDGKEIQNLNEVMNLFGRIKDIENLSITVKREGEEETQEYKFED
jgi:type II secretion system protein C